MARVITSKTRRRFSRRENHGLSLGFTLRQLAEPCPLNLRDSFFGNLPCAPKKEGEVTHVVELVYLSRGACPPKFRLAMRRRGEIPHKFFQNFAGQVGIPAPEWRNWQTHSVQGAASASSWEFKSLLRHILKGRNAEKLVGSPCHPTWHPIEW